MATFKHTPGPWRVTSSCTVVAESPKTRGTATAHWVEICDPAASALPADSKTCRDELPEWQEIANAHLIAAAPELLEALEKLVEAVDAYANADRPVLLSAYKIARAAIAKAVAPQG